MFSAGGRAKQVNSSVLAKAIQRRLSCAWLVLFCDKFKSNSPQSVRIRTSLERIASESLTRAGFEICSHQMSCAGITRAQNSARLFAYAQRAPKNLLTGCLAAKDQRGPARKRVASTTIVPMPVAIDTLIGTSTRVPATGASDTKSSRFFASCCTCGRSVR